jgi:hypothetical protein
LDLLGGELFKEMKLTILIRAIGRVKALLTDDRRIFIHRARESANRWQTRKSLIVEMIVKFLES